MGGTGPSLSQILRDSGPNGQGRPAHIRSTGPAFPRVPVLIAYPAPAGAERRGRRAGPHREDHGAQAGTIGPWNHGRVVVRLGTRAGAIVRGSLVPNPEGLFP